MEPESRAGRIIGVLIIIQMVCGVMVNFVLEAPLFGTPGFLVNAAHYPRQIALAALLGLMAEALWVAIAITAFPPFYQRSRTMTLWFSALAVVVLAVSVVENAGVMSMVSLARLMRKRMPWSGDSSRRSEASWRPRETGRTSWAGCSTVVRFSCSMPRCTGPRSSRECSPASV